MCFVRTVSALAADTRNEGAHGDSSLGSTVAYPSSLRVVYGPISSPHLAYLTKANVEEGFDNDTGLDIGIGKVDDFG